MYKLAALNTINEHLRRDFLAAVADEIMLAVLILMHVDGVGLPFKISLSQNKPANVRF